MTRNEIVVHLVAGMLAGKRFDRQSAIDQAADIKAMHALANKHADELLKIERQRRDEREAHTPYYESWREESLRWYEWAGQLLGSNFAPVMKAEQLRAALGDRFHKNEARWQAEIEALLKEAGMLSIRVREGNGDEDFRATLVATFMSMIRLLRGVADGNANADSVRRALGRIP